MIIHRVLLGASAVLTGVLLTACGSSPSTDSTGPDTTTFVAASACEVLTDAVAQQVLGSEATKQATTGGGVSTPDVQATTCQYTANTTHTGDALEDAKAAKHLTLQVKSALTQQGATEVALEFGPNKQPSFQDVAGFGDEAFWDPGTGKLNIHKGNNVYLVGNYVGLQPSSGTLDDAKTAAAAMTFV